MISKKSVLALVFAIGFGAVLMTGCAHKKQQQPVYATDPRLAQLQQNRAAAAAPVQDSVAPTTTRASRSSYIK